MSNNSNVLIIGASGLLGTAIAHHLHSFKPLTPSRSDLDITNVESIDRYLNTNNPCIIINASGYANVDLCEKNPKTSEKINSMAISLLSKACKKFEIPLIHFSTDYVFNGVKRIPYKESDSPSPLNEYGKHKLEAENLIKATLNKYLIFRISWLYGPSKPTFLSLITESTKRGNSLNIVNDQFGTPNSVDFISREIYYLITLLKKNKKNIPWGLYHLSSYGETTWFNFAEKISKHSYAKAKIEPISTDQYIIKNGILTKRPYYTVLNSSKYESSFERHVPSWEDELIKYFINNRIIK